MPRAPAGGVANGDQDDRERDWAGARRRGCGARGQPAARAGPARIDAHGWTGPGGSRRCDGLEHRRAVAKTVWQWRVRAPGGGAGHRVSPLVQLHQREPEPLADCLRARPLHSPPHGLNITVLYGKLAFHRIPVPDASGSGHPRRRPCPVLVYRALQDRRRSAMSKTVSLSDLMSMIKSRHWS